MPRGQYDRSLDKARRWGLQRAALHDAMAEVLLRLGVRGTVADVCAVARVGRNTFYAHYRSLAQAREIAIETAERDLDRALSMAHADAETLRVALDGVSRRPRWVMLLMTFHEERAMTSRYERALTRALEREGLDRLRARALAGAAHAIALMELDAGVERALEAILGP
ncbi:MAG: hypothetical protein KF718_23665 [Polyangiaceae bacterium]|nr:hypothetical protein [Polyangiaceae bacterium]